MHKSQQSSPNESPVRHPYQPQNSKKTSLQNLPKVPDIQIIDRLRQPTPNLYDKHYKET